MLPGPKTVEEPHKELRFTRGAQGARFASIAALLGGTAVVLLLLNALPRDPIVPWWSALLPLPLALLLGRLAYRCVRHAYILLTPLGIEIFPFFNPRQNLQVLYWSEIADAEVDEHEQLVIHFDAEHTKGVVASLAPVLRNRRPLLKRAIDGRISERADATTPAAALPGPGESPKVPE